MDLEPDACYRAILTRDARFDGRLFVAVVTTGIYCRPICPARTPKRHNVRFYSTAAAAQEAGFRPCLRCRPEIAPDLAAWRGTFNTVSRALSLIEMGALDDGDLEALAARLGVSGRHLRRLFSEHLGASPITVAQTRRVHLAKHLIHETRLPMAEVALASGFGSVRRFNETFRRLYGRAPRELRRRRDPVATAASGEMTVRLPYREPYDWTGIIRFLEAHAIPGVERVENDTYARTLELDGARGVVRVKREAGALVATIAFPQLRALPAIIARLRRVFDLACDPDVISGHLAEDAVLARLVEETPGLRVPGAWDGFELAVRAVLAQQVHAHFAPVLAGRLAAIHGTRVTPGAAGPDLLFPGADALASADLSALGLTDECRNTLSALAHRMLGDHQLFGVHASLEDSLARLQLIPGVDPWTAQYIALRQLREPDAFPATDPALLQAWRGLTGERISARSLAARAEAWRPWRAYAAQHLWASLGRRGPSLDAARRFSHVGVAPRHRPGGDASPRNNR
jgi:AraC family transcriptional regulator of adaptative response / DNA-3-methyladenine glycosylase II